MLSAEKKQYLEEGGQNFIVCDEEHMEIALDEFVDEFEEAPDVVLLEQEVFDSWNKPVSCRYCGQKPKYLLV
ncbi:CxxH/CxxC protein (TIGR04129 family) [Aneurinibacillus soli]|uniref:Uncharacterized protein n=1 Tax=Aneurinibacillus soli TaxID=1500254 RepID=A0A0U5AWG3_9BACL|nr:CxxH/CxxC protein [Aneurinibacillus soli]PYE61262.1 CxxH/CxxC protein (TIGR04129 family) [Aneurinibacillus soli]BAU26304.1 hypothetical protein CB4_00418 [Aneurinibacillus soli]